MSDTLQMYSMSAFLKLPPAEVNWMSAQQASPHCDGPVWHKSCMSLLILEMMQAVVSNASMWDTLPLLPAEAQPKSMQQAADDTPMNRSFMHLHLGFDATGEGLDCM